MSITLPNQLRVTMDIFDGMIKQFMQGRLLHRTYIPEAGLTITFKLKVMR